MRIDFHPDATKELGDAADWYLRQRAVAAQDFAIEVERALDKISADPERLPRVGKNFRACSVTRFPFQVVYRVDRNHIRVLRSPMRSAVQIIGGRGPSPTKTNREALHD